MAALHKATVPVGHTGIYAYLCKNLSENAKVMRDCLTLNTANSPVASQFIHTKTFFVVNYVKFKHKQGRRTIERMSTNIEFEVENTISKITEEIATMQREIDILRSRDWTKPITEDDWESIVEASADNKRLLQLVVRGIFPDACNFKDIHSNEIIFELYGFECGISTSFKRGIGVFFNEDLSQYEDAALDRLLDEKYSKKLCLIKKYFKLKENHAAWEDFMKILCSYKYPKFIMYLLWIFKYKWVNISHEDWDDELNKNEQEYKERLLHFYNEKMDLIKKINLFKQKLLPELNKFTKEVYNLRNWGTPVEKIINWEHDDTKILGLLRQEGIIDLTD